MGKVQGLEVQPRPGIHGLPVGPKPLSQPPVLPPQDPGQWAGEGGVILYPSHQPPELLCWGIPVKYLCLYWGTGKHWGLPERKQAGPSPSLGPGLWLPLPWGRCQAGAQECGFLSAHTLGGEAEQPTPTGRRVEAGEDRPGCWGPFCGPTGPKHPSCWASPPQPSQAGHRKGDRAGVSQDRKGGAQITEAVRKHSPDPPDPAQGRDDDGDTPWSRRRGLWGWEEGGEAGAWARGSAGGTCPQPAR